MTSEIGGVLALGLAGAYLVTSPVNIRYLSGFTGDESELLIAPGKTCLFTDARYTEQAEKELTGTGIAVRTTTREGRLSAIRETLQPDAEMLLGIEMSSLSVDRYFELHRLLDIEHFADVSEAFLEMRCVKTPPELTKMYRACTACDRVMEKMTRTIKAGMTEYAVRAELLYAIALQDAEPSFEPVVAGGANGAMPHAACSDYQLKQGDLLTLDFGCRIDGYCSDMTRTVAIGQVDAQLKKIYDTVLRAQEHALSIARAGVRADRIDHAARSIIEAEGYGENFGHGTGHGVGLQIHELPLINKTSETMLEDGMVFTIEPGIYVPGTGGVRIEDTCTTARGSLFAFTKQLISL